MTDDLLRFEEDGEKVRVFVATYIAFHRRQPTNPCTLSRQLSKSVRNGQPGRAYADSFRVERNSGTLHVSAHFPFSEEDKRRLEDLKAQGREIEFIIPTHLPIVIKD